VETLDQELVQLTQRSERYARRAQFQRDTGGWIDHPGRSGNDMARRYYETKDAAMRALLAALAVKTASEIRMPAIVNLDLLPDMGRMNPRWLWAARTICSLDPMVAPTAGPSCAR
jgi:hypothetical protein